MAFESVTNDSGDVTYFLKSILPITEKDEIIFQEHMILAFEKRFNCRICYPLFLTMQATVACSGFHPSPRGLFATLNIYSGSIVTMAITGVSTEKDSPTFMLQGTNRSSDESKQCIFGTDAQVPLSSINDSKKPNCQFVIVDSHEMLEIMKRMRADPETQNQIKHGHQMLNDISSDIASYNLCEIHQQLFNILITEDDDALFAFLNNGNMEMCLVVALQNISMGAEITVDYNFIGKTEWTNSAMQPTENKYLQHVYMDDRSNDYKLGLFSKVVEKTDDEISLQFKGNVQYEPLSINKEDFYTHTFVNGRTPPIIPEDEDECIIPFEDQTLIPFEDAYHNEEDKEDKEDKEG
jgi:hypothetical protein